LLTAVIALFGCGPCAAQESGFGPSPTPGSGAYSPLGGIVTSLPVDGTGIDLGLSELYVVGLSPLTTGSVGGGAGCPDQMTEGSTPASTPDSMIPGYGSGEITGPVGVSTTSPGCGATTIGGANLAAGLSSAPGSIAVNNYALTYLGAPLVPLGVTTLSTAGIGPPLVAPAVNCSSITGLSIDGLPSISSASVMPGMASLSTSMSSPSTSMSSPYTSSMSNLYTSASSLSTNMSFSCGTTY
jgi:hypothetical protein